MVYIRGVMLHPPMARLATVAELMQYTADVVHPKAKSAGEVQWAHSSPSPPGLPGKRFGTDCYEPTAPRPRFWLLDEPRRLYIA